MKKLTSGIFAGILAVVAVGTAHAEIATTSSVNSAIDGKVGTWNTEEGHTMAGTSTVGGALDALDAAIGEHTTAIGNNADAIDALKDKVGTIAVSDQIDAKISGIEETSVSVSAGNYVTGVATKSGSVSAVGQAEMAKTAADIDNDDAALKPATAGAVKAAIASVTSDVSGKQDADTAVKHEEGTAVGGVDTPVYVDADGNATVITFSAGNSKLITMSNGQLSALTPVLGDAGNYVLTATVTADGTATYHWELISGRDDTLTTSQP